MNDSDRPRFDWTRVAVPVLTALFVLSGLSIQRLAPATSWDPRSDRAVLALLPPRFEKPILALEFPRDGQALKLLLENEPVRYYFAAGTRADFWFIPAYAALWALVLWRGRVAGRRVGPLFAGLVVVAALFDVLENAGILRAVREAAGGGFSQETADFIRRSAQAKWSLLGIAFLGMFSSFWPARLADGWDATRVVITLAYGAAGVLCFTALSPAPWLIEQVGQPLAIALVLQLVVIGFGAWSDRGRRSDDGGR